MLGVHKPMENYNFSLGEKLSLIRVVRSQEMKRKGESLCV